MQQQQVLQNLEQQLQDGQGSEQQTAGNVINEYLEQPMAAEKEQGISAGYDKGFFINSADGDVKLKVNGYLRYHAFLSEANTVTHNTVRASESRIDFNFYFMKDWHLRIRPDFSAQKGNVDLREMYLEFLGWRYMKPRIGGWIVPFSLEYETSPSDLLATMYSPYLTMTGIPTRELGAMIFGDGLPLFMGDVLADYFCYSIGIFNGSGMNNTNGSLTGAQIDDDDMLMVAQTKFFPLSNKEQQVFFQAGMFMGDVSDQGAHTPTLSMGALLDRRAYIGNEILSGRRLGLSFGGRYWLDNLRIESEVIWTRFNRDANGHAQADLSPLVTWGAMGAISYFFALGEPEQNMGIEPLFKVSFTSLDDTGDRGETRGQDIWEVVIGSKFHFNKHARIDFNWVMYDLKDVRSENDLTAYTNSSRGHGGGLLHAFVFQFVLKW